MLRRKAEEEEEKAALVVGAGGGGVGARPHEYENARRENSCHCLTQPTPTPCPRTLQAESVSAVAKGGREGERTASHAMACVSFSTTLPSSLPPLPVCSSLLHHPTAPAVLTFTHLTFLSPEPGSGWPRARVLKNYMPNRNCMFNISNNKQRQQQQ